MLDLQEKTKKMYVRVSNSTTELRDPPIVINIFEGDEGNPRCQNCIVKNLKCSYGVQLTFHDANLFSLDPEEARDLRNRSSDKYQTLQVIYLWPRARYLTDPAPKFVDGWEDVPNDLAQNHSQDDEQSLASAKRPVVRTESNQASVPNETTSHIDQTDRHNLRFENREENGSQQDFARTHDVNDTDIHEQPWSDTTEPRTNMEHYKHDHRQSQSFAGRIDPSLMQRRDINNAASYTFAASPLVSSCSTERSNALNHQPLDTDFVRSSPVSDLTSHRITATTKTHRDLLKFFIDKVAPWVC